MTRLSKVLALKALEANNNKVVGDNNGGKANKIVKNLFKSRKLKQL